MDDRRKYNRLSSSVTLKYEILYSIGFGSNVKEGEGIAHSINLSEGGLLFISKSSIPLKSFLEVELNLPGEKFVIYIKGEVVHSKELEKNKHEIGIQFEYKFEKDSEILHHYVMKNSESLK
ncbi:MAG: PilZ domain-containing protein [Spirochaetota bacterium]|nr:PilZ domain-containing protein [Spirochaetota bacterium]